MTMEPRSSASLLFVLAAAVASAGCRDAPLAVNVKTNIAPLANAGPMQELDYSGSPVAVKLDGGGSIDPDGKIVSYRWLSGADAPDGGMGRAGMDPDDVMSPTVTLDAGIWSFVLFVSDDDGEVSEPSVVTIKVGSTVAPEVPECSAASLQTISEDCRSCVCGLDDMCRTAIKACDQACWDFYGCVQNQCGAVVDDMTALPDCVRMNCTAFFGGVGPFMPLDPCLRRDPCKAICSASVKSM
jgi:hypothetical protein